MYNATSPYPVPTPTPALQRESESTETENSSVGYGEQLDYRYYSYTTRYYNYMEFQKPPAEFTDVYSDYGEDTDVPPDGFNNSLVINVGVNVTKAGRYQVSGSLYENGTWQYITGASNASYLSEGNQTVQLRFDGIRLRQNKYNGTYDLKYLYLYNYSYPIPPPTPTPTPVPASQLEKSEAIGVENVSVLYGEQLDYRYYAYTTGYYEWPGWPKPPAEFTDIYSDYGEDTDGDGLYDYLVVNVGVNVTDAGNYWVSGSLYENSTYNSVDYDSNTTYLCEGNQTVQLRFDAWKITKSGTFDLKYLYLYNSSSGVRLDYRYYAHTTGYYEPLPRPALFNDVYLDYGEDTDGDGLNNSLIIEVGVNVTKAGTYRVRGELYENATYHYIISAYNTTYLDTGNHSVLLKFDGIRLRQNKYNGTYDLKYLYLYNYSYPVPPPTPTPTPVPASQLEKSEAIGVENVSVLYGEQLDYRYYAYTTGYYEWPGWQTIPPCYNYTKEYITYDWDAISTPDQNWTGCDDCSYNYVLPWNFTFFCENHSSIQISTNGLITFPPDASSHCYSPDLENTVAIAPFWGDLSQACGQGTNISVQDKGDRVVVVWYTGTYGGGCLNKDLFEVILYENGKIRFNYNYLNNIPYSVGAGISNAIVYYTNTWGNSISVVYSPINETVIPNISWNMTISATNQLEPVVVGMHPNATDGYDTDYDAFVQTPVQGKVILILDDIYSKSIKKTRCYNESVSWNLSVGVPTGQTTTLSWDVPSNVNLTIREGESVLSPGVELRACRKIKWQTL